MPRLVEWIGVKSPLQDDRVTYRKIRGLYTTHDIALLNGIAKLLGPLIRQYGTTSRIKNTNDGYSKTYQWGPRSFVCEMTDKDADYMFAHDPDQAEFRDLNNPAHDDRKPEVPEAYITKRLNDIIREAENGPNIVERGTQSAVNNLQVSSMLERWLGDQRDQIEDKTSYKTKPVIPPSLKRTLS